MSVTFKKAPLIEIIAEIRWDINSSSDKHKNDNEHPVAGTVNQQLEYEGFFDNFSDKIDSFGFSRSERLIPKGNVILGQPIYRFRAPEVNSNPAFYQVGFNMFSANAVPPYHSWHKFSPKVVDGINALFSAREKSSFRWPISSISLRYINAFKSDLTGPLTPSEFIQEVLGFKLVLPGSLSKLADKTSPQRSLLQTEITLTNSMIMNTSVYEATVQSELAVLMDTTVSQFNVDNVPNERLISILNEARDVIHESFTGMIAPIREALGPEGGSI